MDSVNLKPEFFTSIRYSPKELKIKSEIKQSSRNTVDSVSISAEGKIKSEEKELKDKLNKALYEITQKNQEVDKTKEGEPLERQIKEIQEKIRELNQEIAKLDGKKDEASIKHRESLIMLRDKYMLQLLELYNQQLQEAKAT